MTSNQLVADAIKPVIALFPIEAQIAGLARCLAATIVAGARRVGSDPNKIIELTKITCQVIERDVTMSLTQAGAEQA